MELTLEVKGKIADITAVKFSWDKITTFGTTIGVDVSAVPRDSKRKLTSYIMEHMPKENAELALRTLFEMSTRGPFDADVSNEVLQQLNPILEHTMNIQIDENGDVKPLFPLLKGESDIILEKLEDLGFTTSHSNYTGALTTFSNSPKGSLGLLRATVEGLTDEILAAQTVTPVVSYKDRVVQLRALGVLEQLPHDSEVNYTYDLYGLLSHYGSHPELVDDDIAEQIFTSGSVLILFLLKRYQLKFPHN